MTLKKNMCVLSSHTCGACLAKWTGQSWKETYDGILPLKTWTLVLNKSFQLCIEGRYDDYGLDIVIRIPVKKRVNSRWVANERTLVKLHGPLFSKDLPDFVVARFSDGIPVNWKVVAEKWVDVVCHGENSSFSLNLNDTLTSDSTRSSRNRRTLVDFESKRGARGGSRAGSQRRPPTAVAAASAKRQSSDSAFQSVQGSSATPSNWVSPSPWLPPHKVKEITQWMNRSPVTPHIPPDPLTGLDSEPGDGGSIMDLHLDGLPSAGACTTASPSSVQLSAASHQRQLSVSDVTLPSRQKNNAIAQSTPLTGTQDIRPSANPLNFSMTMSSVSHMELSSGMASFESVVPQDDVFRKPMVDGHGVETPASAKSEVKKTESSAKRVSKPTPSSPKPVEAPGAEIGRMENSSRSRPLRKHSPQKIERWRPILGVDGTLKLQGYLVLRGDMTAGQILTTNEVVKWSGTKVTTCDKREYELIGDMYDPSGKISASLRTKLKKAMSCSDIQEALQETQALRENVTCFLYLAPPPAPEKTCTTRSGRVCRPCAPYWLNRSDWGAEYDIFYHDLTNPEKSSSSPSGGTKTPRSGANSTSRRNNASSTSGAIAKARRTVPTPTRPRHSRAPRFPPSSSSLAQEESPARKSLRLSRKVYEDPDYEYVSSRRHSKNNERQQQPLQRNNSMTKKNNKDEMSNGRQPSKSEDYVMHVSPSRIKVSYPSKTLTSTVTPNKQQDSVRCRPQTPTVGLRPRTPRTAGCPAKLSCDTCCGSLSSPHIHNTSPTTRGSRQPARVTATKNKTRRSNFHNNSNICVDRNLRGTLGKTRLQTLHKSPRVIISPLKMNRMGKGDGRRLRTILSPKKLFSTSTSNSKTKTNNRTRTKGQKGKGKEEEKGEDEEDDEEDKKVPRGRRQQVLRKRGTEVGKRMKTRSEAKKRQNNNTWKKNLRATTKQKGNNRKNGESNEVKDDDDDYDDDDDDEEEQKENDKTKKKRTDLKSDTKSVTKMQGDHNTIPQKTRCVTLPLGAAAPPPTTTTQPDMLDVSHDNEEEKEDSASVCSNASDMSVGPSASVIFAMNAAAAEAAGVDVDGEGDGQQRAPRTLRERRKRDAALRRMKELVDAIGKGSAGAAGGDDDDPVAQLIHAKPFQPLPQEWCDHSKWVRQGGRKRRRPSSSDGTASPSRSALSSDGGHEDATSSVATPQLLMRRPDPKQVQSYLQRLRAMNSKPHRPTRRVRADRQFHLPDIDYSQAFRNESSSDSGSESPVDSDWEG